MDLVVVLGRILDKLMRFILSHITAISYLVAMITVFTPIHKINAEFIKDISTSLEQQTNQDFEWILCANGDATEQVVLDEIKKHTTTLPDRTYFVQSDSTGNVAHLKSVCCAAAKGAILVELDYDDYLSSTALQDIADAFTDKSIHFAYSNCIEFIYPQTDERKYNVYGSRYGWRTRQWSNGEIELISFPTLAQYVRRIEWSPNHVRAFRKSSYQEVGGYDVTKHLGDDHDLVCRFYLNYGHLGFKHIDKPLYYYRVHSGNTCNGANRNKEVQHQVAANYEQYAEAMFCKWSDDVGLDRYDLGGAINRADGYTSVDIRPEADIVADLSRPWPMNDNSAGVIRAHHVLEHIRDSYKVGSDNELELVRIGAIHFFNESYRVLAPGGLLIVEVPSISGDGAVSDPTHVRFFNQRSFRYYYDQALAMFIQPEYNGRFQLSRITEHTWPNTNTSVINCHLIALKGWYDERWCGEKLI